MSSWVDDIIKDAKPLGKQVLEKHKDVLVAGGKAEFQRTFGGYYSGELDTFEDGLAALDRLTGVVTQENADRAALLAAVKEIGLTLGLFVIGRIV